MHKTAFESCLPTPGKQVPAGPDWIHEKIREITMTTVGTLLAQKQQLLRRLQENPGPHERDEIERLLAQIDAALNQLDE